MIPRTDHVADHVDDYLYDLLDADDSAYVAQHCADCPACAAALEEARRGLAALQALPPSEASEQLVRSTLAGVANHLRRKRRYVLLGCLAVAATAAAIIAAFHLHYSYLKPTPFDLKVLGQTQLLAGSAASLRVQVIKRFPEAPGSFLRYSGVPVEVVLLPKDGGASATLASFRTDTQGSGEPRFQVPDWPDKECELIVTAQTPDGPETIHQAIRVKRSRQVMLSSDKPVYQPGQTVHVRSLALRRPDLHPVAGEEVTFTVTDPKGNVIFKQSGKNSPYGIASIDCPLATEIIEGQYVIGCTVGDTASRLGVEVKKYVLPKFKIGVTLDKPYYAPDQTVTATVEAAYFFGKPVAGGTVELEARASGEKPLCQEKAKTDDKGRAVFSFDLPKTVADRSNGGDVRVTILATVTDTAGQKQGKETATLATNSPLKIEVFPECGTLPPGIKTTMYVFTSYADGRPAKTTVKGPGGIKTTTNDLGVGSFDCTATQARPFLGSFRATDPNGISSEKGFRLEASSQSDDFLLRSDKAVYDGGDTMTLSAIGSSEGPVYVDLIKDGQTLLAETIPLTDGKGQTQVDLPPELSGTLQVCAYRLAADSIPVSKTRTLFVRPAKNLQVQATTDRAEYRPGGKAQVRFELLDKVGRPARGALSLAAVDEAVFSVLEQAPGSETQFFTTDSELLRRLQALFPWSPDLKTDLPRAERDRFEQALFARTVRTTEEASSLHSHRSHRSDSPLTLEASTFGAKSEQVEKARDWGLSWVAAAWVLLAAVLGLLLYVLLVWVSVNRFGVALAVPVAALLLFGGFVSCGGRPSASPEAPKQAAEPSAFLRDTNQGKVVANHDLGNDPEGQDQPRVRQHFPETLLWRPELITDDNGRAHLDIDLADSITTWRLTASAVAADGRLGATQAGIKVFQSFFVDLNLPVSLTRGDEVAVPVVVYNYLDKPQTVALTLTAAGWFECLDDAAKKIDLATRAVSSTSYRLRIKTVGRHALQVMAKGGDLADAIRREVEVVPDGRRVEEVVNGSLAQPAEVTLTVPENAIEGSPQAFVKIYPSNFSQLVEGLDGIFQKPYGCFEQTSSTTYPNVLALDYLRQTGRAAPEVKDKAERFIHLGYQRLLGFEVSGGGFDWFGHPPANLTLTAYGLMEFRDMALVHTVDPQLIARTRDWLLKQRNADGSWSPEGHAMHDDPTRGRSGEAAKLSTTAYLAWAVFGEPGASSYADATRRYLLSHKADSLDDPYVLALVANALNTLDPEGRDALPYLDRLEALKKPAEDGKLCFWEQRAATRTAFYGAGRSGSVETTALAALALLYRNRSPETTRRALAWLVKQKDAAGTWPSTQATVLALKALLAGTGKAAGDGERRLTLAWDDDRQEIVIPKDQAEVMKQLDLSARLKPGTHRLTLTETSGTAAGYQVAFRYHVPDTDRPNDSEALSVRLSCDRDSLRVDETMRATATVTNRTKQAAPMVVLEAPVPAGFAFDGADLDALLKDGKIAKYQPGPGSVVIYLRELGAGQALEVKYGLRGTMPVKVSVPPARAYEYYDPDKHGTSAPARLTVQ
jgi:hypothetical protein